ncbi:hypothetical protein C8F01DRAFT_1108680 [Mycena amicta]|nr:hypothetical protein C8F01DRAFT_1108680 [Mycena amicta]
MDLPPLPIKIEDQPFPPAPNQPKLTERGRRSTPLSLATRPRRTSSRRSRTPYSPSVSSRPRRTRPDPAQLSALQSLYSTNPSPSIEERTALALAIGMDAGKVTNYFRNQRQSSRKKKRTKSGRSDEEYSDGSVSGSASTSRACTPTAPLERTFRQRTSRPVAADPSSDEDEPEEQEAVTPPPAASSTKPQVWIADALHKAWVQMAEYDKSLAADALLLLEFQATNFESGSC